MGAGQEMDMERGKVVSIGSWAYSVWPAHDIGGRLTLTLRSNTARNTLRVPWCLGLTTSPVDRMIGWHFGNRRA